MVPYDNVVEKAVLDVTSGVNYYDVVDFWYPGLGTLVENGVLKDLDSWYADNADALQLDDLITTFKDVFSTIDGKKYAFPFDGDMHLLYYNTEIFDQYGQTFPTTWMSIWTPAKPSPKPARRMVFMVARSWAPRAR